MIFLGVDPGLGRRSAGLARVRVDGSIRAVIGAWVLGLDPGVGFSARMEKVSAAVVDELHRSDVLVVEDQRGAIAAARKMGKKGGVNRNSDRLQGLVEMLRGVALVMGKPCIVITPQQVRVRLGCDRSASKHWMHVATSLRCRGALVEGVGTHARDAVSIAVAGEIQLRGEQLTRSAS